MDRHEALARELEKEHRDGVRFHAIEELSDLDSAYGVQRHYVASSIGSDRVAGYKIGLTSRRMQIMCGIDHPISGAIDRRRILRSGARLNRPDFHHLGLEFEICARLGRDLGGDGRLARREVEDAVDAVCPAIEVIDDRHADYATLHCATLVADNSWNAGAILGEFRPPPADLAGVEGVVLENGVEIGRGKGSDALGHPFEPLTWLANRLAAAGGMLRKGDIVMTGSIVTTRFPVSAFTYRFEVTGLGVVEVSGE